MDNNEPSSSSAVTTTKGDPTSEVDERNETDSGGYSYEIVDASFKQLKELECPICCLLMRDAHELGCHHAMCSSCLDKWEKENIEKKGSFTCPQCCLEVAKEKTVPSSIINRLITTSIKVKCDNSGKGCEWIGVICDIVFHMKKKCDFTVIKCLNERCTEKIQRNVMDDHVAGCLYRIINCTFCNCEVTIADQNDHLNGCEMAPVQCGNNGCLAMFPINEITSHVHECNFKPIKCQFESIGCKIELTRKDMEEHLIHSTNSHMNLMILEMKTVKMNLKETKTELNNTKVELENVKMENDQLRKLLENIFINDIDIFIKKSQYFQDMERSVIAMEKEFIAVNDEVKERIKKYDLELKLMYDFDLQVLNNLNKSSINSHNNKFQNLDHSEDCHIFLLNEVRDIFLKHRVPFTAVEEKLVKEKTSDYYRTLTERSNKYLVSDWKETTYSERIAAMMEYLPENNMMMRGKRALLKLRYCEFDSSWELKIRKSDYFDPIACRINPSKKTVKIELPRFFFSAGVCDLFRRVSLPLKFKRKSQNDQYFAFNDFEFLALYLSNGFILIEFFNEPWKD